MAETMYVLCALTSMLAASLLLRRYRQAASRLLFWSAIAFTGLAIQNILVVIDLIMIPQVDLSGLRAAVAAVAMLVFVCGLISETA